MKENWEENPVVKQSFIVDYLDGCMKTNRKCNPVLSKGSDSFDALLCKGRTYFRSTLICVGSCHGVGL